MEFEKFKKHIDRIIETERREEELSDCIEKNLAKHTFCIVDLSADVTSSLIELLADYYNCHIEFNNNIRDNEISWWLSDNPKIIEVPDGDKMREVDITDIHDFWKYLEDNRNQKINDGTYIDI